MTEKNNLGKFSLIKMTKSWNVFKYLFSYFQFKNNLILTSYRCVIFKFNLYAIVPIIIKDDIKITIIFIFLFNFITPLFLLLTKLCYTKIQH